MQNHVITLISMCWPNTLMCLEIADFPILNLCFRLICTRVFLLKGQALTTWLTTWYVIFLSQHRNIFTAMQSSKQIWIFHPPLHRDSAEIVLFAAETCLQMSTTNRFISPSHGEAEGEKSISGSKRENLINLD